MITPEQIKKDVEEATGLYHLEEENNTRYRVTAKYMYLSLSFNFTDKNYRVIAALINKEPELMFHAMDTLFNKFFYDKDFKGKYDALFQKYERKYGPPKRKFREAKTKF